MVSSRPGRCRANGRNWDYRFCWLRDSTFILITLLQAGMRKEAAAWVGWLRRAVAGEPIDLQPLYTVGADRLIVEWEVEWLDGFNGARPVRVGNAATKQRQLDIYGEVIETLSIATRHGLEHESEIDRLMRLLAARLAGIWDRPDAGIWEIRAEPRHFVYSKAMCWKAFDCAAHWFAGKDAPLHARYAELASRVKAQILERGFDAATNAFVSHYGSGFLDAAALRLPLIGFLPATDPRIVGTVDAIERELVRDDGLVRRYQTEQTDDGRREGEGAFLAASLWLADVYALQDRTAEARALFRKLCGLVNDVGLLAEEQGANGMLGNFPQGLSHLSLVTTAMNLSQIRGPARERGERSPQRLERGTQA